MFLSGGGGGGGVMEEGGEGVEACSTGRVKV